MLIGKNVEVWKGVIGGHGEDIENDSSRTLLGSSAGNELKMVNTHFDHIHKLTWSSPCEFGRTSTVCRTVLHE